MRLVVHKYVWPPDAVTSDVEIEMPRGAQILHVGNQNETICIWARVDLDAAMEARKFAVCGTGSPCPAYSHIGTVLLEGGGYVFHVFDLSLGRAATGIL